MVESVSLLNEIRSNGYEGAILTTYKLHIPFLEEVVVRRLHASGCRHVIVLADQHQLAKALSSDTPRRAGYDYVLVPIHASTAFHPKIMLLAGKSKGFLAVGSHNLTYAGFGHNREVTNVVRFDTGKNSGNAPLLRGAWHAVRSWLQAGRMEDPSDPLLGRLPLLAPWLADEAGEELDDVRLLCGGPNDTSLFDQLRSFVGESLEEVYLMGPFFDSKLRFVNQLTSGLNATSVTVAIDPATAQIPAVAQELANANFVTADAIGPNKGKYLHAKVLWGRGKSGTLYLLSGSANPSAPAWLNDDASANYEAMLALKGNVAERSMQLLGLSLDQPSKPLDDSDWVNVREQWERRDKGTSGEKAGVDVVLANVDEEGRVSLQIDGSSKGIEVELVGSDGVPLSGKPEVKVGSDSTLQIGLPSDARVSLVKASRDGEFILVAIVHYPAVLHERAKTGTQRRFSMAFSSLDTDTPALNELFKCIEQVIDEDQPAATAAIKSSQRKQESKEPEEPESLEISIDDLPSTKKRKQLSAGTNLGFILDILIRSLGQDIASEYEELDAFGRNEEERVGSDDESTEKAARTDAMAEDVLNLCHKKIRRLVSRAVAQLDAFSEGRVAERSLVVKMTAVLALVSQLRAQDKHIWWVNVDRGESTVPQEELERLMASVSVSLLAHPLFLYEPVTEDHDLPGSDEYARLRGLMFWLGASVGLTLRLRPPFNEKTKDRCARIQANQDFLTLSDLVVGDKQAAESAEDLINTTDAGLRSTLNRAFILRHRIDQVQDNPTSEQAITPGDFAFNPKMPGIGVRAVLHADSQFVELAAPGGQKPRRFKTAALVGISADELRVGD
jgi:hypothetical protein